MINILTRELQREIKILCATVRRCYTSSPLKHEWAQNSNL